MISSEEARALWDACLSGTKDGPPYGMWLKLAGQDWALHDINLGDVGTWRIVGLVRIEAGEFVQRTFKLLNHGGKFVPVEYGQRRYKIPRV
jgi:hypothetical protein